MQIVVCNPMWYGAACGHQRKGMGESDRPDRLIPQAPSIAEINKMLGMAPATSQKMSEGGDDDLGDDFSDDVKGIAPAVVDPAPAPGPKIW